MAAAAPTHAPPLTLPAHAPPLTLPALASFPTLLPGDRASAADALVAEVKAAGPAGLSANLDKLRAALDDAKNPAAREGGLVAIRALCEGVGRPAEPYLVDFLPAMLALMADKVAPVRDAANAACTAFEALLCPHAVARVLPAIFDGMRAQKWQTNEGACNMLGALAGSAPAQVAVCLPEIVPVATEAMGNARQQVKDAAVAAMTKCCHVVGNRDMEPFIPILINCMQNPVNVPDTVHKLASTTFVQVRACGRAL